jgi:hypothetical protein
MAGEAAEGGRRRVLGAGPTSDIKGNLFIDMYLELLGASGHSRVS